MLAASWRAARPRVTALGTTAAGGRRGIVRVRQQAPAAVGLTGQARIRTLDARVAYRSTSSSSLFSSSSPSSSSSKTIKKASEKVPSLMDVWLRKKGEKRAVAGARDEANTEAERQTEVKRLKASPAADEIARPFADAPSQLPKGVPTTVGEVPGTNASPSAAGAAKASSEKGAAAGVPGEVGSDVERQKEDKGPRASPADAPPQLPTDAPSQLPSEACGTKASPPATAAVEASIDANAEKMPESTKKHIPLPKNFKGGSAKQSVWKAQNYPLDGKPLSEFGDLETYVEPRNYERLVKLKKVDPERSARIQLDLEYQYMQRTLDIDAFGKWFRAKRDTIMAQPKYRPGIIRLLTIADRDDLMQELLEGGLLEPVQGSRNLAAQIPESLWSNVIKWLGMQGQYERSMELLDKMREAKVMPRARTYQGLLAYFAENAQSGQDLDRLGVIYEGVCQSFRDYLMLEAWPEEDVYISLLEGTLKVALTAAANGDSALSARASAFFDRLLGDHVKATFEPSEALKDLIRRRCEADVGGSWTVTEDAVVDADTAMCSCCGTKLFPIEPSAESMNLIQQELKAGLIKNLQNQMSKSKTSVDDMMAEYEALLDTPYDVVVDAANISYYKQNFSEDRRWSFRQLQQVLDAIGPEKQKLVVMHKAHANRDVRSDRNRAAYEEILNDPTVTMYLVKAGNDDLFWLEAALKRNVPFVSNDFLRDHASAVFSSGIFKEWKERYQTFFRFFRFDADRAYNIEIFWPPKFSLRAQQSAEGSWHVPRRVKEHAAFSDSDALPVNIPEDFLWTCFHRKEADSAGGPLSEVETQAKSELEPEARTEAKAELESAGKSEAEADANSGDRR